MNEVGLQIVWQGIRCTVFEKLLNGNAVYISNQTMVTASHRLIVGISTINLEMKHQDSNDHHCHASSLSSSYMLHMNINCILIMFSVFHYTT